MPDPRTLYADAIAALNRADWTRAKSLCDAILPQAPEHPGVHFVAGVAALEMQQIPVALRHLHRATTLNPTRADYAAQLARALARACMPTEAQLAADHAMSLESDDATTLATLGMVYSETNAYHKSEAAFRRAVEVAPHRADLHFNLATLSMTTGDLDRAEAELEACLTSDPNYWKAWLALVQLRKQTDTEAMATRLDEQLKRAGDSADGRTFIHLALAKVYEDAADYARAFEHYAAGKHAAGAGIGYTAARDRALFEQLADSAAKASGEGCSSEEPIFVIGMPRTGTTLADRILSSHPNVYSAGELRNFAMVVKQGSGSVTRKLLDLDTVTRAARSDLAALGRNYVESTRPATAELPHFVDKMPHNFLYAGFIAKALPKAKIICMRRNPMDTCLSNFRQLFAKGAPFFDYSCDILDVGHYYILFDRLVARWQELFPGRILEVQYEDLVANQEQVSRRMLAHCGLEWDPACLHFERNTAPVATASAIQVREPMSRASVARWKRYRPQLAQLEALLRGAGFKVE